jgi:hypothetical protein
MTGEKRANSRVDGGAAPESELGKSIDPPRNFTISTEERVRALAAGPPAWALRKRRIEDAIARYEALLREVRDALLVAGATAERIEAKMTERAKRFDLAKTNALIEAHNRYYPIEANLPIDPRTGGLLHLGKPWKKEPFVTVEVVVARLLAETPDRRDD